MNTCSRVCKACVLCIMTHTSMLYDGEEVYK